MNDLLRNKIAIIERCLRRIREEYDERTFYSDYTKQDSVILNLQRACESAIDMGSQIIRQRKLGIPQTSRDVFVLLETNKLLSAPLAKKMQAMVGFRNIAVHDYQEMNLDIVSSIVKNRLEDFTAYIKEILEHRPVK